MVTLGIQEATVTLIGNTTGDNNPKLAIKYMKVILAVATAVLIIDCSVVYAYRFEIASIFSSDIETVELIASLFSILVFVCFLDGLIGTTGGGVKGLGLQKYGAITLLVGYYVFSVPIGCGLTFSKLRMGNAGLWLGIVVAVFLIAVTFMTILVKADWHKIATDASIRL